MYDLYTFFHQCTFRFRFIRTISWWTTNNHVRFESITATVRLRISRDAIERWIVVGSITDVDALFDGRTTDNRLFHRRVGACQLPERYTYDQRWSLSDTLLATTSAHNTVRDDPILFSRLCSARCRTTVAYTPHRAFLFVQHREFAIQWGAWRRVRSRKVSSTTHEQSPIE